MSTGRLGSRLTLREDDMNVREALLWAYGLAEGGWTSSPRVPVLLLQEWRPDAVVAAAMVQDNERRSRVVCKCISSNSRRKGWQTAIYTYRRKVLTDEARRSTLIIQELQIASPAKLG